jgi:hypothetical protein
MMQECGSEALGGIPPARWTSAIARQVPRDEQRKEEAHGQTPRPLLLCHKWDGGQPVANFNRSSI